MEPDNFSAKNIDWLTGEVNMTLGVDVSVEILLYNHFNESLATT